MCVTVPVQISYASDWQGDATAARRRARASARPANAGTARCHRAAENGINLELGIWIIDPELGGAALRSDIYYAIWREFRARGIAIPYPQREVRMLGGAPPAA